MIPVDIITLVRNYSCIYFDESGIFGKESHSASRLGRTKRSAQRPSYDKNMRFRSQPRRLRTKPLSEIEPRRPVARQVDGPGVAQIPRVHHTERRLVVRRASLGNHDTGQQPVPDHKFVKTMRSAAQRIPYAQTDFMLLRAVRSHARVLAFQPGQQAKIWRHQRHDRRHNGKSVLVTISFFYQVIYIYFL